MAEWELGLARLKEAYSAWHETKGGSLDTWINLLADEVDFRSLANGRLAMPWTKRQTSPAEVREYLNGLTSTFKMDHYTVERYVCQDDTVVAICSTGWHNRATGKAFDTPKVDVWRFKRGKAVAYFEYYDTAAVGETVSP